MNVHSGPAFGILLTPSRRLVGHKPESFLRVEQIRSFAEVRDTVSGQTNCFYSML